MHILDMSVQGSIQVLLESNRAHSRDAFLLHYFDVVNFRIFEEIFSLGPLIIIHSDRVLNEVTFGCQGAILLNPPVLAVVEFDLLKGLVTVSGRAMEPTLDLVLERLVRVCGVGCRENVLRLDTGDEASVAGQALVLDLVSWTVNPSLGVLASVTDHQRSLVILLRRVYRSRSH